MLQEMNFSILPFDTTYLLYRTPVIIINKNHTKVDFFFHSISSYLQTNCLVEAGFTAVGLLNLKDMQVKEPTDFSISLKSKPMILYLAPSCCSMIA